MTKGNRRKRFGLMLLLSISFLFSKAQHQEIHEKPGIWKGKSTEVKDTLSLLHAIRNGKVEGHFRYYFCATDNHNTLSDYYANAFGGGLRYETGKFHGFQFGLSGFYVFNIGSTDLTQKDSSTQQQSRYELGLFDVEDPSNKKDIDRLEELYLKYTWRNSYIRFGKQLLNTPFINLQDGRMRPTGAEGFWFEWNEHKKWSMEGGWLYAISPRSTVRWYSTEESVGVYPMGVTTSGKKSNYLNNLSSQGVFLLGMKYKPSSWLTLSGWNLLFDQVMNTAMLQSDIQIKKSKRLTYLGGLQWIRQDAIASGGNSDPTKTYIDKGARSMTAGARLGVKVDHWEASINYNRIFKTGRYLMPREWGRDPFFTFIPRERNEGFGDVHAIVGKLGYHFAKQHVRTALAGGYVKLPDVKNFALNKYGLPSYMQVNLDIRYAFTGLLNGLEAQGLLVGKLNEGDLHNDARYEINKVNMVLYNVILNYHF